MQGYGKGDMRGIIPRSIEKIGIYRDTMIEKGWVYTMEVTFIEIYNEQTFDLLREEGAEKTDLPIKQDNKGKTYIQGVNKLLIDPTDLKAIDDLMDTAALHRATASTDMNSVSSRSHSIFSLYLKGANEELGAVVTGCLHLCDLAGSERIARSGAEGDRLKEAININKSLSCLTDVFNGLAQKQAFVPFRNSKLTYFLQPALSGDGKTMMFVNLSPTHESYFESLCSLRFANGVNKIELGKATRNVVEAETDVKKKSNTGQDGGSKKKGTDKSPAKGAPKKGKK
jgi:kinesin family protein C1